MGCIIKQFILMGIKQFNATNPTIHHSSHCVDSIRCLFLYPRGIQTLITYYIYSVTDIHALISDYRTKKIIG